MYKRLQVINKEMLSWQYFNWIKTPPGSSVFCYSQKSPFTHRHAQTQAYTHPLKFLLGPFSLSRISNIYSAVAFFPSCNTSKIKKNKDSKGKYNLEFHILRGKNCVSHCIPFKGPGIDQKPTSTLKQRLNHLTNNTTKRHGLQGASYKLGSCADKTSKLHVTRDLCEVDSRILNLWHKFSI